MLTEHCKDKEVILMANEAKPTQPNEVKPAATPTNPVESKLIKEILGLWPVKILTSWLPGGGIIEDIIIQVVDYISTVEKAVAIKGAGVAKKAIVVDATKKYIIKKFPELAPFEFIISWGVGEIVDFIVNMKNKYGWDWIPLKK